MRYKPEAQIVEEADKVVGSADVDAAAHHRVAALVAHLRLTNIPQVPMGKEKRGGGG